MEPAERPRIEDAVEFVTTHSQVFLLSTLADGSPIGYPMVGRSNGAAVEFSTYRKSAKVRNVLRHPTTSCLVVPRAGSQDRRTLWVSGPVSVTDDASGFKSANGTGTSGIAVPSGIVDTVGARHDAGKRCILRIEIEQFRFGTLPADTEA